MQQQAWLQASGFRLQASGFRDGLIYISRRARGERDDIFWGKGRLIFLPLWSQALNCVNK
jgi:hypothetical protein